MSCFTFFPLDHSVVVWVAGGGVVVTLAIDDFWGMTISASSALMDVFFLEAVEGEGAAAAVMDGLWRLVLLRAVDADNFFLSAAEERAGVATGPAPTTDFFALAFFLVGIVECEENGYRYYCAVDDCCDVGCVITECMSVVGVGV